MTKTYKIKKYKKAGRPRKAFPKHLTHVERLGGMPMKCENGRIMYKYNLKKAYNDSWVSNKMSQEEVERIDAPLPQGEGSFVRRHIYEIRFGIEDETDKERRKREYEEWWKDVE